jgi:hypothetical protein
MGRAEQRHPLVPNAFRVAPVHRWGKVKMPLTAPCFPPVRAEAGSARLVLRIVLSAFHAREAICVLQRWFI